jgi:hypothetical protein
MEKLSHLPNGPSDSQVTTGISILPPAITAHDWLTILEDVAVKEICAKGIVPKVPDCTTRSDP